MNPGGCGCLRTRRTFANLLQSLFRSALTLSLHRAGEPLMWGQFNNVFCSFYIIYLKTFLKIILPLIRLTECSKNSVKHVYKWKCCVTQQETRLGFMQSKVWTNLYSHNSILKWLVILMLMKYECVSFWKNAKIGFNFIQHLKMSNVTGCWIQYTHKDVYKSTLLYQEKRVI